MTALAPDFLTFSECAERAGVSTSTIKREVRDGKLKPSRIRGRVRIALPDWQEYLTQCRSVSTVAVTKFALNSPLDGLAKLLRIGGSRRSSGTSKIVELDERRAQKGDAE